MLTQLDFTNFKSWPSARLGCKRITGIFGTNSSGKTSLLQFILLLKQTKDATDRSVVLDLNGQLVQLGTIKDVIHLHNEDASIEAQISFRLPDMLTLTNPSEKRTSSVSSGYELKLATITSIKNKATFSNSVEYQLGSRYFRLETKSADQVQFNLLTGRRDEQGDGEQDFSFVRSKGRPWQLPGPIKSYAFPDQARTYYQNAGFLADLEAAYERQLDQIFYLGPLRENPKRDYLWAKSRPTDVGVRGEKAIDAILAATDANESRNLKFKSHRKSFQEIVAHWLRELGLISSFEVVEIAAGSNRWQAKVRTREGASEVLLTDVGFGVSQVLPVITLLQYVPEGSTVLLEQPEIHLHPLAQAGLADVIIQAATHRKIQVIVESHSEHFLLRLQRRIAEKSLSIEDVSLYFCDAPKGVSELTELSVDLFGSVLNWPPKFMGDAFGEVAKAEIARLSRQEAAE